MEPRGTVATYRPSFDKVIPYGRTTEAERKLLAACKTGGPVILGDRVPEAPSEATRIRAGLIRYLLLGGCAQHHPHPKGIRVTGAWIDGALDFAGCETSLDMTLARCHFPQKPVLRLPAGRAVSDGQPRRERRRPSPSADRDRRSSGRRIPLHRLCRSGQRADRRASRLLRWPVRWGGGLGTELRHCEDRVIRVSPERLCSDGRGELDRRADRQAILLP